MRRRHSPDGTEDWLNWIVRVREGGEPVGTVQATVVEGGSQAEIAWVVGTPWQGRGYAREATSALVAWLRGRGVARIVAHVHPDHAASEAVARAAGLVPTDETQDGERLWLRVYFEDSGARRRYRVRPDDTYGSD